MRSYLVLIPLIVILAGAPASGENTVKMGLREAVETALKDNPRIKASTWGLKAVQEDVGIARSYYLPSLTFEDRYMRTDNPTYAFMAKLNQQRFTASDFDINSLNSPQAVNDFQGSVKLEQVIFSERAITGLRMAKLESKASGQDFERLREKVTQDVISAYLGVITSRHFADVAEQGVKDAGEHKRLATLRYNTGLGLYSDVLRAEAAQKEAERKLSAAQKANEVAKRALGLALGRSESVDAIGTGYKVTLEPIDAYYGGLEKRPDIQALETRTKNAENGVTLAKSGYLPEVGVGGQYQWNDHSSPLGAEGSSYMVNAFLRWSIFDGARREHQVSQARAKAEEARQYLEGLKKQARFQVFDSYKSVEEAQKSLDLANAELSAAEEGTRLVTLRYQNSLSPIIDVLDSQLMLDAARTGVVEAQNNLMEKFFNLGFESGMINEFIQKINSYKE
ncbi:MAG: TolC family protein [Nitrospiraceae bacterium]|nr:TolC family protein [Nitrospiraceae bacterium]